MLKRLAVVATCLSLSLLAACGQEKEGDSGSEESSSSQSPSAGGKTVQCDYPEDGQEPAKEVEAPSSEAPAEGTRAVTISSSAGEIGATLDAGRTPCTVNNFVSLAEQGWFDGTTCHRLTTEGIFVLQCGDPTATGMGGPGYTIPDEVDGSETYAPGTLAMAKTTAPDSGGSQFFMVYEESPLPPDYTVFGQVDEAGVQVLQDVAASGTETGASDGAPKEQVTLESVSVD